MFEILCNILLLHSNNKYALFAYILTEQHIKSGVVMKSLRSKFIVSKNNKQKQQGAKFVSAKQLTKQEVEANRSSAYSYSF